MHPNEWKVNDFYWLDKTDNVKLIEKEDTAGNKIIQFENFKQITITIKESED